MSWFFGIPGYYGVCRAKFFVINIGWCDRKGRYLFCAFDTGKWCWSAGSSDYGIMWSLAKVYERKVTGIKYLRGMLPI